MTTKETEIPTFYLTKKKKKQIYKITVWNVLLVFFVFFTGFVFIPQRNFKSSQKHTMTSGNRNQTRQFIYLFYKDGMSITGA